MHVVITHMKVLKLYLEWCSVNSICSGVVVCESRIVQMLTVSIMLHRVAKEKVFLMELLTKEITE